MIKKADRENKFRNYRIIQIDKRIRKPNAYPSVKTLMDEFEVSKRTIMRDIEFLKDRYNAPIEYDAEHKGYYYTDKSFAIQDVYLTEKELFAIKLVIPLLEQYKNTPLELSLKNIMTKISGLFSESVSVDSIFFDDNITFISESLPKIEQDVFENVFKGIRTGRVLLFSYRKLESRNYTQREFAPFHIICKNGSWYVIGYEYPSTRDEKEKTEITSSDASSPSNRGVLQPGGGKIKTFSLSRMKNVVVSEYGFTVPSEFNILNYIDPCFGVWDNKEQPQEYKLLFSASVANFVTERTWHKEQSIAEYPDGSVMLSFKTNQKQEVLRMVQSFGNKVKVLSPDSLKNEIKIAARQVLDFYS